MDGDSGLTEGQQLELEIIDKSVRGDGIAKVNGFVVFVKGAEKGSKVNVKIVSVKPRFALAEIVQ
ncbi:TRAM domain protein [uncultured archaeon]|nr:TRAM domain protein [uncultured archaeon]